IARKMRPPLEQLSSASLALLVVGMTVTNFQNLLGLFGTRGVLASIVFLALGAALGWLLGGRDRSTRSVMVLGTAQRNIAAALVVGGQSFPDPLVVVLPARGSGGGFLILCAPPSTGTYESYWTTCPLLAPE